MNEHVWNRTVYYSDTDAQGIIYHAAYINMAEHARTEALRSAIPDFSFMRLAEEHGAAMVIKSISADYRSPGHLGDTVTVKTMLEEMGRVSCVFRQSISLDDRMLCEVRTKLAFVDPVTLHPVPVPQFLKDALDRI